MVQQVIFLILFSVAIGFAIVQYRRIRQNILLGKPEPVTGPTGERWRNLLLVSFGQQKMFKRVIPAVLHLFLYLAFVITQIELIEIIIDGLFGVHRFFAPSLSWVYTSMISFIEILSVGAFIATVAFLARRNVLHVPRLEKPELRGWPSLDANLILLGEILLLIGIFTMNGTDTVLQERDPVYYPDTGRFAVSGWLGPLVFDGLSTGTLMALERAGWWLHLVMVLAFLNYLPISKHLHILLAFPNTYFARLKPRAEMENMPEIETEVRSMMGFPAAEGVADTASAEAMPTNADEIPEFGARDVFDLTWIDILGAYSCTECGRCTDRCPANITGKALSPRKIVMNVRDRAEEVGVKLRSGNMEYAKDQEKPLSAANFDDGRSLWDYISAEEINACTTCQACIEACPVLINPLEPILKMRRNQILSLSAGPTDWLPMFNSIENAGAAWSMGVDRDAWAR